MQRSPRTAPLACLLGAIVLVRAESARALCHVALEPENAPPGWGSATHAVEGRVAASRSRDCRSVEVVVGPGGGAMLTFTTTDGRRAVRALASPDELVPAVDALLVTLPEPADPAPSAGETPHRDVPVAASNSASVDPRAAAVPPPKLPPLSPPALLAPRPDVPATSPDVHFILGASAGIRVGFSGTYAAPSFAVRPSGMFGHYELAGFAELEPVYAYLPGGVARDFHLWSFVAGVQVGRREPLKRVTLGYGLGFGIASVNESASDGFGVSKEIDFAQPRASIYARAVLPPHARWRLTLDLGFDAALANFRKGVTLPDDAPELPRFGVLLSVGVETSLL